MTTISLTGREQQLIALVNLGRTTAQIAHTLCLTTRQTKLLWRDLAERGLVSPAKAGRPRLANQPPKKRRDCANLWQEKHRERIATVVRMKREGATRRQISATIGLGFDTTKEFIEKMLEVLGPEVFELEEQLLTIAEVARRTGMTQDFIRGLCETDSIPHYIRGEMRQILIAESTVEALVELGMPLKRYTCRNCGESFESELDRETCSDACRHEVLFKSGLVEDRFIGWRREVQERLRTHTIPTDEEWLRRSSASKRAGLNHNQLMYLRKCGLVSFGERRGRRRGQLYYVYSASQMDIVREVYRAFQEQAKTK